MGSIGFQFSLLAIYRSPSIPKLHHRKPCQISTFPSVLVSGFCTTRIECGLRGRPRKPLWRSRVLSSEALQAVHALKLAKSKSPAKLEDVFNRRLSRLLKADLLDTLAELRRQNELDLTLKVFEFVRKEEWYRPDLTLYCDMILLLGKNKLIDKAEELFLVLKKEGLIPDARAYTEMIGAFLHAGMIEKAMETYESMKFFGCPPNELTLTILIRNLENAGEEKLVETLKKECDVYLESPEKFLEEVGKRYVRHLLLPEIMSIMLFVYNI